MSEDILMADGPLKAPGHSNAIENEENMKASYDTASEDDLLGKSEDDEQIPPYRMPCRKRPKQQCQSQNCTSRPRIETYRKRRHYSPSTERRKRSQK